MKRGILAALIVSAAPAVAGESVTVWRDPGCGCCEAYADYLVDEGFAVTVVDDPDYADRSLAAGLPVAAQGCHHAEIGGYVVSGHVPSDIIARLLRQRPDVTGITLPGMPANSPGMAPEKTGTLRTYAFGPGGLSVFADE